MLLVCAGLVCAGLSGSTVAECIGSEFAFEVLLCRKIYAIFKRQPLLLIYVALVVHQTGQDGSNTTESDSKMTHLRVFL